MHKRTILTGVLVAIALAAQSVAVAASSPHMEAQAAIDNVTYTVPAGWSETPANDSYRRLEPVQLNPAEALTLVLLPTVPATVTQADALSQAWDEILTQLNLKAEIAESQRYQVSPPIQTSDGRTLLLGDGRARTADGVLMDLRVYILQEDQLYLRVFGLANVLPNSIAYPPTSALHNPRFAYQMPDFVLSLSTGREASPPPGPEVSLSGLWRGLSMFGGEIKDGYVYFYPDGRAYLASSMPLSGFAGLPVEADAVLRPASWGRYSFDGHEGELLLPYQSNATFPFTRGPANELTLVTNGAPHQFAPQPSVDGQVFDGTYTLDLLGGETLTLTLSAAGQFSDRGVVKLEDHWVYPFRESDQPGGGTYAVTEYTIVFHYTDGRIVSVPFSGLGLTAGNHSPAQLAIGPEDDLLMLASGSAARLVGVQDSGTAVRAW